MIFEALLLLLRADNSPENRYVLWRKLHACAVFSLGGNGIMDKELLKEINAVYYRLEMKQTEITHALFCKCQ